MTLECGGFKSRKYFKFTLLKFNDFLGVEKARDFSNLFEVSFSKSLFDNNVDKALSDRVFLISKSILKLD